MGNKDITNISSHSNLYDSITREIVKISDYEEIDRYVLELDANCKNLCNLSKDIFKFLMVRHDEIMNDCIVRSFINIHLALKRSRKTFNDKIESSTKDTSVQLSTESFGYIAILIDDVSKLVKMRNIKDTSNKINSVKFRELINFIKSEFDVNVFDNYININIDAFKTLINDTYDTIKQFMVLMRDELEHSVSSHYNITIMKNTLYVALIIAMILEKVII